MLTPCLLCSPLLAHLISTAEKSSMCRIAASVKVSKAESEADYKGIVENILSGTRSCAPIDAPKIALKWNQSITGSRGSGSPPIDD